MKDFLTLIINNIRGSLLTTVIGCIILTAGLIGLFWTELNIESYIAVEVTVLGVVVACLKDPSKGNRTNKGGGVVVTLGLIIFLSSSCITERRCANKFGTSSTSDSMRVEIETVYRDSIITIQGDSVHIYIENPCDSLGNIRPTAIVQRSINGRSTATAVISSEGIAIDCSCDQEKIVIKKMRERINAMRSEKSLQKIVEPAPRWSWFYVVLISVGFIGGLIISYKFFK
jgi:hypothetical protein